MPQPFEGSLNYRVVHESENTPRIDNGSVNYSLTFAL